MAYVTPARSPHPDGASVQRCQSARLTCAPLCTDVLAGLLMSVQLILISGTKNDPKNGVGKRTIFWVRGSRREQLPRMLSFFRLNSAAGVHLPLLAECREKSTSFSKCRDPVTHSERVWSVRVRFLIAALWDGHGNGVMLDTVKPEPLAHIQIGAPTRIPRHSALAARLQRTCVLGLGYSTVSGPGTDIAL